MAYYDTPRGFIEFDTPATDRVPAFRWKIPIVADFPQNAIPGDLCCLGNRIYCCTGSRWIGVETAPEVTSEKETLAGAE